MVLSAVVFFIKDIIFLLSIKHSKLYMAEMQLTVVCKI